MLAELLEQDRGEQLRAEQPTRRDMERRGRLGDPVAVPARELLAHGLDDLHRRRDTFERAGHVLAELRQSVRTAAGAVAGRGNDDALARQVRGKVATWRAGPHECGDRHGLCRGERGAPLGLGGIGIEIFEGKLELRDQARRSFGTRAVERALHLGVLQFEQRIARQQIGVDRVDIGGPGLGFVGPDLDRRIMPLSGHKRLLQRHDIGGERCLHRPISIAERHGITSILRHCVTIIRPPGSPRCGRSPRVLRVPPVDPFEHVAELRRRDRDDPVDHRGPDETAAFEPLGVQRHADPVMPEYLDQIAFAAAEYPEIADVRIASSSAEPAGPARACRAACRSGRLQSRPGHRPEPGSPRQHPQRRRNQRQRRVRHDLHPGTADLDHHRCRRRNRCRTPLRIRTDHHRSKRRCVLVPPCRAASDKAGSLADRRRAQLPRRLRQAQTPRQPASASRPCSSADAAPRPKTP